MTNNKKSNKINNCAICLEDISKASNQIVYSMYLECGHEYHYDCLIKYFGHAVVDVCGKRYNYTDISTEMFFLMSSYKCPMCRYYIDRRHIRQIIEFGRETLQKRKNAYYMELKKRQLQHMFYKIKAKCGSSKEIVQETKESLEIMSSIYDRVNERYKMTKELYNYLRYYNQI